MASLIGKLRNAPAPATASPTNTPGAASSGNLRATHGKAVRIEDADEHARIRRVRRQKAARRAIEIRRRSLNEAQRSLAASRYRKGVDPSAVAEKMHEIDRRLLALPHEGE